MIAYEFVACSLRSIDALEADLLVLPFFADERPLRGVAGLVDWRLCGRISRRLLEGTLTGEVGEHAMVAAPPKLKPGGLLLVGLGHSGAFDPTSARHACREIAKALADARVSTAGLALPGRSLEGISAIDAMSLWLAAPLERTRLEEVTILESAEEHRALASLLDGRRRQAESPLA